MLYSSIYRKYPDLVRTQVENSENLEEEKVSNCVRIYFSCFTKICNIQNTEYSETILVYF